jgi:hypothetical protein
VHLFVQQPAVKPLISKAIDAHELGLPGAAALDTFETHDFMRK